MEMVLNIFDLLAKSAVKKFCEAFLKVANMQISFADPEHQKYNMLYSESRTEFCRLLNGNKHTLEQCIQCSRRGGKEAYHQKKAIIYECHAGLKEIVVPIIVDGIHIGSVFSGQILTEKPNQKTIETVVERYTEKGLNKSELFMAYRNIPLVSEETVTMITNLLSVIVDYMVETEYNFILNQEIFEEKQKLQDVKPNIINEFATLILENNIDGLLKIKHKLSFVGIEPIFNSVMYIQISDYDRLQANSDETKKMQAINEALLEMEQIQNSFSNMLIHAVGKGRLIVFFTLEENKSEEEKKQEAIQIATQIIAVVKKRTSLTITAGISRTVRWFTKLGNAYREAKTACLNGLLLSKGLAFHITDILPQGAAQDSVIENLDKLREYVIVADEQQIIGYYEQAFKHILGLKKGSLDQIRSMQIELLDAIFNIVQEQGIIDDASTVKLRLYKEILLIDQEESLYNHMISTVHNLAQTIENFKKSRNHHIIAKAKKYIEEKFYDDINLEEVASLVFLSPNYFGWLFKREVGLSYIDYLTDIRIQKAKQLLRDQKKSIRGIAVEVGYKDPNYFSQVFLKAENMRPSAYRQMLAENEEE